MNTPQEKPRRWFQIHLSTGIVLMVFFGLLLGLNLGWELQRKPLEFTGWELVESGGWPFQTYRTRNHLTGSMLDSGNYIIVTDANGAIGGRYALRPETAQTQLYPGNIVANILIDLCILGFIVILLEWRIRRAKSNSIQP